MTILKLPFKSKKQILALGPESAGNFSFYQNGQVKLSEDFGDLLNERNLQKYKRTVIQFLQKNKFKPTAILTDLHPLYHTTIFGRELAKKYKAQFVQVQHHKAHVCSALGEYLSDDNALPKQFIGIACDGTGYGTDGTIWGGEVFQMSNVKCQMSRQIPNPKSQLPNKFNRACRQAGIQNPKQNLQSTIYNLQSTTQTTNYELQTTNYQITRIGSLELQTLIGGDLAVREPARVLLAILHKAGLTKEKIWLYIKKHYNKNQFELLYNQLLQNFNCQETSSTARILDAASLLLGFCTNDRNYKHEPALLLEKNSSLPNYELRVTSYYDKQAQRHIIYTTKLFQYLIKNLYHDKRRLAATVQLYLAKGLYTIVKCQMSNVKCQMFFSGGLTNNKIMSQYLQSKGFYTNKKIPCGDASLSFGQIVFYLLTNPRNQLPSRHFNLSHASQASF